MTSSYNKDTLLGLHHPRADPQVIMDQWRSETIHCDDLNKDPADILADQQERDARFAALETFITLDKITGNKYGNGLRYLFAIHAGGQSVDALAQSEKTTPEKIQKALKDTCDVLRPVLGSLL